MTNFDVFSETVPETIRALRATGRKVVILEGIPEIGWNVPRVMGNSLYLNVPYPAPPTLADVDRRNARANQVIRAAAKEYGATVLSLVPDLCTPLCQVEAEGRPLYSDDDHLSQFGAERVIPKMLRPILDLFH